MFDRNGLIAIAMWSLTLAACKSSSTAGGAGESGTRTVQPGAKWEATFPETWQPEDLKSVGVYRQGPVPVNFESMSPLLMEPTQSGGWEVVPGKYVVFQDAKPGLVKNPEAEAKPFYKRSDGAITAMAWVDQSYENVKVDVNVNVAGGRGGQGSVSRQGPMIRWDKGSNWLWCAVDFGRGMVSIVRSEHFGVMKDIPGSSKKIEGFDNKKSYSVSFTGRGSNVSCSVSADGKAVAETGEIADPAKMNVGVTGILIEVSLDMFDTPLEGSFADLRAESL